jgi:hypothetical protein
LLGVCVELSTVSTADNILLLSPKATSENRGFIWPEKRLFKAGYKKSIKSVIVTKLSGER